MKYSLLIVWMILSAFLSPVLLADHLGTPIQVQIYPKGANVTWIIEAQPEMTLYFPSTFIAEQIHYQTREGATVKQMEVITEGASDWLPEGLKDTLEEMVRIHKEIEKNQATLAGINQTIDYLRSYSPYETSNPLEFIKGSQILRIESEIERQRLLDTINRAQTEIRDLEQKINRYYGGDLRQVVRLFMETNGKGLIEITAFTPHASWRPLYKAYLDSYHMTMLLNSYVQVQQRTGIPWDGRILCHTAAPHDRISIPIIRPMVARIMEESIGQFPFPVQLKSEVRSQPMMDHEVLEMERWEGEAGISFVGEGQVMTDGQPHLLLVNQDTLMVNIHPTLVPFQEDKAWLMVETKDPVHTLLQGTVELVVDGSFSGRSTLQHTGALEPLEMAFGRSPLITAEREPVVYYEKKTWTGRKILQDGYKITVHNGTRGEVEIVLLDRVPIAGDDRIRIDLTTIEPLPEKNEDGILLWRLTLGPKETTKVMVQYEIQYPNNMDLIIN